MTKKKSSGRRKTSALPEFDKYWYYEHSVQNFENEVDFLDEKFTELTRRKAYTLREDFCGTGGISCQWVSQGKKFEAWGVDLDPEPIEYGKQHHLSKLPAKLQPNMHYIQGNVLNAATPKVDICFAFNFSYQIFTGRKQLLEYFKAARKSLKEGGVFFLDMFGGPDSQTIVTDVKELDGFKYYWECQKFNPLDHSSRFAIHFKRDGEKKRENVFIYEWRMWSMPEIRDLLEEAGFKKVVSYWEGEDGEGGGNGIFTQETEVENCPSWVTYLAAMK